MPALGKWIIIGKLPKQWAAVIKVETTDEAGKPTGGVGFHPVTIHHDGTQAEAEAKILEKFPAVAGETIVTISGIAEV